MRVQLRRLFVWQQRLTAVSDPALQIGGGRGYRITPHATSWPPRMRIPYRAAEGFPRTLVKLVLNGQRGNGNWDPVRMYQSNVWGVSHFESHRYAGIPLPPD